MRILILPKYGSLAASTRHRFLQFLPFFEERGIECEVSPLLDNAYLTELFDEGHASYVHAARALVRRLGAIMRARRFDAVLLYLEGYPYVPLSFSWMLRWEGIPYVYDLDDAIFHQYDQHPSRIIRSLMSRKIPRIIAGASVVLAGNKYLADYARRFNDRVELVPTVIDLDRYPFARGERKRDVFTIGWIGSPSTSPYLHLIEGALRRFCAGGRAKVVLVGAGAVELDGVPVEHRRWSEDTEVQDLLGFDVGIMPLPDTPWARGKCGFKLIQYMACGLPVVASAVGANLDIVEDERSGLLRIDEAGWIEALERLDADPELCARLGRRGREIVEEHYSSIRVRDRIADELLALESGLKERESKRVSMSVIDSFGQEWSRFDQAAIDDSELATMFDYYFHIFPWKAIPQDAIGFDLGCGSGRWAKLVSPRVGRLHCIDPSDSALTVARRNLQDRSNCEFHLAGAEDIPLDDESADFGYSLGVLHHLADTKTALRACVGKLKRGAPFLLYLYYAFDNRPAWYRMIWGATNPVRVVLSRAPFPIKYVVSQMIAAVIYYPLARLARLMERFGTDVTNYPLAAYRHRSYYVMRTDSLDRFGTLVEKRFTRSEIEEMMVDAGLENIRFSDEAFWCAVGFKK